MCYLRVLLFTNLLFAKSVFSQSIDSVFVTIAKMNVDGEVAYNIGINSAHGIDSIDWPLNYFEYNVTETHYDSNGVIISQDLSDKKVIKYNYKISSTKRANVVLPSGKAWIDGTSKSITVGDTLTFTTQTKPPVLTDFFGKIAPKVPNPTFDCPTNSTCSKAYFVDTVFNEGDTLTLVIAMNKSGVKFQIPSIKGLKYITHRTSYSTSTIDGKTSQASYVVVEYNIATNLKKIKTPTFKARVGARTQYIKSIKIKRPKVRK